MTILSEMTIKKAGHKDQFQVGGGRDIAISSARHIKLEKYILSLLKKKVEF